MFCRFLPSTTPKIKPHQPNPPSIHLFLAEMLGFNSLTVVNMFLAQAQAGKIHWKMFILNFESSQRIHSNFELGLIISIYFHELDSDGPYQTTVDSSEIRRSPVEGGGLSHDIYIPGGCLGLLPAQLRCYGLPDFPSKALEEGGVGGFNLLPSTGPVATWMGRCLSSQRGLKHMNLEVRFLPGPCCFRPRVLALILLGESKADV